MIRDGVLTIVGKSVPLSRAQATSLAQVLTPAGPGHPSPDEISSSGFGSSGATLALTNSEPIIVAEALADTAFQAWAFRHPGLANLHTPVRR